MAKVILICGKICCGKSTHASRLRDEMKAVVLSVDEIMLALFGRDAGERHDEYARNTREYLLEKSVEIVRCGINVILDWGFWTRRDREDAKDFFKRRGVTCETHYIVVDDGTWKAWIAQRNEAALADKTAAYPVDEGLLEKFTRLFEPPVKDEIDIWIPQQVDARLE